MPRSLFTLFISFVSLCLLTACSSYLQKISQANRAQQLYALENVHVIPISSPGVLHNHTLIVRNGEIEALGPTGTVPVPPTAQRLPVAGKYLIPGLADMHVHISSERDLLRFLQHGVTQLRNMSDHSVFGKMLGYPPLPELRDRIKRRELLGPRMTSCGPFLDGDPPQHSLTTVIRTAEEAQQAVQATVEQGFDCVKVYNQLSASNYQAVARAARQAHIPIMGHVPHAVGLDGAISGGMRSIEHLNAYIDNFKAVYRIAPKRWPEAIQRTIDAGIYNCPTLSVWASHPRSEDFTEIEQDPRFRYLIPSMKWFWKLALPDYIHMQELELELYPTRMLELSSRLVKALADAGAPLLIGTDANLVGIYPGDATWREMELFAQAGVAPQRILEAATLNAAKLWRQEQAYGSIEIGKAADFVLLQDNPLQDISAIRHNVGVMLRGRWLTQEQLTHWVENAL